ncbi:hypothetical protein BSKO_06823 [Bryopsis sp. KO-2023]|nr:hypothetical protein BSKO_06823 [Bryopsis sp. KO-2023]
MLGGNEGVAAFSNIILEFLEAVVHQVLFVRGVYESDTFEERRLYETIVHKSRHPGVVEYVNSVVSSLKASLDAGNLQSFNVVFSDADETLLAKMVLEFKLRLDDVRELETVFRNLLRNLSIQNSSLTPLPQDATFEIVVCTKKGGGLGLDVWCEEVASDLNLSQTPAKCTPIKSIDLGSALQLHLAIVEKG